MGDRGGGMLLSFCGQIFLDPFSPQKSRRQTKAGGGDGYATRDRNPRGLSVTKIRNFFKAAFLYSVDSKVMESFLFVQRISGYGGAQT